MAHTEPLREPLPPFTEATAREKVQKAEDAWNTRDPEKVALAYTLGESPIEISDIPMSYGLDIY